MRTRYEYDRKYVAVPDINDKDTYDVFNQSMNSFGAEGWKIVDTERTHNGGGYYFIVMRELEDGA